MPHVTQKRKVVRTIHGLSEEEFDRIIAALSFVAEFDNCIGEVKSAEEFVDNMMGRYFHIVMGSTIEVPCELENDTYVYFEAFTQDCRELHDLLTY